MLSMEESKTIADLYHQQQMGISAISRIIKRDPQTIRDCLTNKKWLKQLVVPRKNKLTKIDPYKEIIDEWLDGDRKARRKQRHTAQRVFNRLKEEHGDNFNCSYRTIADFVKKRKKELFPGREGFLPLTHYAGEAEVDFGSADFYEDGKLHHGKYLVLSLPFSNAGYLQLFKGENIECLLSGMQTIFEHLGGTPTRIVFDNASTMVVNVEKEGKRKVTDNFYRFSLNYGFTMDFCNPASGHEKGNVESKVGYLRKNMLVPVPEFKDIEEYNKTLLLRCDKDTDREHYAKSEMISELLKADKKKFIFLPESEYEVAGYEKIRTNGYGKFSLNAGKHTYSSAPKYASSSVIVKTTAHHVTVLDADYKQIIKHKRLYGESAECMDWLPYLTQLSYKPKAIKYSELLTLLPQPVQDFFQNSNNRKNEKTVMQALAEITDKSSFETGIEVLEQAVSYGRYDIESIRSIYKRMTNLVIELPTLETPENIPKLNGVKVNISMYDSLLKPREANSV